MPKEIRKLVKKLEERGYVVDRENGRYYKVRTSDGRFLYSLPATPGRGRWLANLRAELRRRGLIE